MGLYWSFLFTSLDVQRWLATDYTRETGVKVRGHVDRARKTDWRFSNADPCTKRKKTDSMHIGENQKDTRDTQTRRRRER